MGGQSIEHVFQVGVWIVAVELRGRIRLMIAAARLPARSEPANNQFERPVAQERI
jgi:hypothetical protein